MKPSQETIAAYADGELDDDARREVEAAIAADPELAAQVASHRALKARLSAHFAPLLDRPVPGRLLGLLTDAPPPDNVVNFAAPSRKRMTTAAPRFRWAGPALAASLAVVLVGYGMSQRGVRDYAVGDVAAALDGQLVATQSKQTPVRILLSFRDGEGRFCRGFSSRVQSGVACRDGRGWKLGKVIGGGKAPAGEYRQAGSGEGEVLAAIQELAHGPALDEREEREAMQAGWRER